MCGEINICNKTNNKDPDDDDDDGDDCVWHVTPSVQSYNPCLCLLLACCMTVLSAVPVLCCVLSICHWIQYSLRKKTKRRVLSNWRENFVVVYERMEMEKRVIVGERVREWERERENECKRVDDDKETTRMTTMLWLATMI